MKHENCEQISSLLIMSVHGRAFLLPLLSVQLGFLKLPTICSYIGSFGSLGNFPFPLPLWNSDVSLSTTLLHIPPYTENLSSLSLCCLTPPPGASRNQLFLRCFLGLSLPHTSGNAHLDFIFSARQANTRKWSFSYCIAKSFYQKGQQNTIKGDKPYTKHIFSIRAWKKMMCFSGSAKIIHSIKTFSTGVFIVTKTVHLIAHLIVHQYQTLGLFSIFITFPI